MESLRAWSRVQELSEPWGAPALQKLTGRMRQLEVEERPSKEGIFPPETGESPLLPMEG